MRNSDFVPGNVGEYEKASIAAPDNLWDTLRREIEESDLDSIILSSEEFDILDKVALDQLALQMSDYEIRPIVFLRNLSDFVESGFGTDVMFSGTQIDIENFARNQRSRIDFHQLLTDWHSISSCGNLSIVSYDDQHLRADVVLTFLRLIGLNADAIEPERLPFQNESSPAFVVEIIRHLRTLGAQPNDIDAWKSFFSSAPIRNDAKSRFTLLSNELRQQLDEQYIQELESISADSTLAGMVHGQLILPPSQRRLLISDVNSALAAFAGELNGPNLVRAISESPIQLSPT